jgi:hypothetical protein
VTDDVLTPAQRRFFDAYMAVPPGGLPEWCERLGITAHSAHMRASRIRSRLRDAGLSAPKRPQMRKPLSQRQMAFLVAFEAADYGERLRVAMDHGYDPASAYSTASKFRSRLQEMGQPLPFRRVIRQSDEAFASAWVEARALPKLVREDVRRALCERRGIGRRTGEQIAHRVTQQRRIVALREQHTAQLGPQMARPAPARSRAA